MSQLVQLGKEDVNEMVAIHRLAFPQFFLTALGKNVLRVFYSSLLSDQSTIAFGVKNDQSLIGFFVASTCPNGLYSRIFKKNFFRFFIPLTISFLKNLSLLKRMIVSFTSTKSHEVPDTCNASLLSICVSPNSAGKGVGKILLVSLEAELNTKGQQGYYLTTDAENNDLTNQFYQKNDFMLHSSFSQGNRKMNLYTKLFS